MKRGEVQQCACGDHVFAHSTLGYVALFSPEDAWIIKGKRLTSRRSKRADGSRPAYAQWRDGGENPRLVHREIMKPTDGMTPDHKNGDRMDNRRSNLRLANSNQNQFNKQHPIKNRTGFIGVIYDPRRDVFYAWVEAYGKRHFAGTFRTAEDAAIARDRKAIELHGEFAVLNSAGDGQS
jgi:hypothetical protein